MTLPLTAVPLPASAPRVAVTKENPMVDTTLNATNDSFMRGSSNGYVADMASLSAIHNSKDTAEQLQRLSTQMCAGHADLSKSIDGNSFRALEQFGIASTHMEKHFGATDVLIQKTTGELVTQVTLVAKDGIIDAAKNAAAATLLAHQLAAAAAAKAAECCCEIKAKVVEEACSTRALIAEIERRNADRRECDLKTDLSNCRQTAEIARLLDARLGSQGHGCCNPCPSFTLPISVVPCPGAPTVRG